MLGLDRAPEVKIRRKLGELAAAGRAADLQLAIAEPHASTRPDDLGFLYTDGRTRAYFGTREAQKTHVARLRFPSAATGETWVTGQSGDPLLVVIGGPSDSLAARIKDLLPGLRGICGEHARPVLCFDRGGWSPGLFAEVIAAGFGLLTYRENIAGKPVPGLPGEEFSQVAGAAVIYRMTSRRREENWFRYGRARLDAPVEAARRKLAQAQAAARQVPAMIPRAEHNPAMMRLETQAKLITHAVKMAAYNAGTALARALHGRYARAAGDEACALIREALHASGDIIPGDGTLTVRPGPLSATRRTRAIAALCGQLNDTRVCYPGTSLVLRFEVKDHPGTT